MKKKIKRTRLRQDKDRRSVNAKRKNQEKSMKLIKKGDKRTLRKTMIEESKVLEN